MWPVATNAAMLANLLDHPDFREGVATTNLVEADLNELALPDDAELADALILGAIGLRGLMPISAADPWDTADGFRVNAAPRSTYVFDIGGETRAVKLEPVEGVERAHIFGESFEIDIDVTPIPVGVIVSGAVDGAEVFGVVRRLTDCPVLFNRGRALALRHPEFTHALEGLAAGDDIRAPMPGKVLDVKAKPGQDVKRGDPLVVMEAMKMEHTLAAPRDGRISEVSAIAGAQTAEGAVLVKIEPRPE